MHWSECMNVLLNAVVLSSWRECSQSIYNVTLKIGLYRIRDGSTIGIQLLLTRRVSYC